MLAFEYDCVIYRVFWVQPMNRFKYVMFSSSHHHQGEFIKMLSLTCDWQMMKLLIFCQHCSHGGVGSCGV